MTVRATLGGLALAGVLTACPAQAEAYPWHYDIVATNFWVGQVISSAPDGSQKILGLRPQLGGELRRL